MTSTFAYNGESAVRLARVAFSQVIHDGAEELKIAGPFPAGETTRIVEQIRRTKRLMAVVNGAEIIVQKHAAEGGHGGGAKQAS